MGGCQGGGTAVGCRKHDLATIFFSQITNDIDPGRVGFAFFTGNHIPIGIHFRTGRNEFVVRWPDATMTLQASEPLVVSQEMLPDNTLESGPRSDASPDHLHTCIVVKGRDEAAALTLVTEIVPKD